MEDKQLYKYAHDGLQRDIISECIKIANHLDSKLDSEKVITLRNKLNDFIDIKEFICTERSLNNE